MRTISAVLFHALLAPVVLAAGARITFERILPAPDNPSGFEDIAVVHTAGNEETEAFVEALLAHASRSGLARLRDARERPGSADAYLDIKSLKCDVAVSDTEASVRDPDGRRIKTNAQTSGAACFARIDVLSRTRRLSSTFFARGQGMSRRVEKAGPEEGRHALADALHYAALDAVQHILPRRVRESIELDPDAPAFEEGVAMIEASRLADARMVWQRALGSHPQSAALHFNVAAVCEALGDRKAAEQHYVIAKQLSPDQPRYRQELKAFARRH